MLLPAFPRLLGTPLHRAGHKTPSIAWPSRRSTSAIVSGLTEAGLRLFGCHFLQDAVDSALQICGQRCSRRAWRKPIRADLVVTLVSTPRGSEQ